MAYRIEPAEPISTALRRIVAEEVDAAVDALGRVHLAADPEAVHEVRKHTKKLRALFLLVSGSAGASRVEAARRSVAEAARTLAPARDAHVLAGTLAALRQRAVAADADVAPFTTVGICMAEATAAASDVSTAELPDAAQHASWLLTAVVAQVVDWDVSDDRGAVADALADGYGAGRRRLRRLARATANADRPPADLAVMPMDMAHAWRRRVKQHWYHLRLVAPVAPDVLAPQVALFDELGEALGVDHDLALLVERLADDPDRWGGAAAAAAVAHEAGAWRADLAVRASELGRQVYVDQPRTVRRRFRAWLDQSAVLFA
jgi:CHAD domain-containing protein